MATRLTEQSTRRSSGTYQARDLIDGVALLAGPANVVMQLARPGVGYGVVESTVESGQTTRHPIKRTRTTLTYLSVAMLGTEKERAAYRQAVNGSHVQVRSGPDSPVKYNAFDPDLQLWVAACLYRGLVDTQQFLHGEAPVDLAEFMLREAERLGTTLQVKPEMWPTDQAAFDEYWERSLDQVSIDDTVRRYLTNLLRMDYLPRPITRLFGPFSTFVSTGFLPQRFRDEMRLPWTERDQRRFDRLMRVIGRVDRVLPGPLRRFPLNAYLLDFRIRLRFGKPLV
jgi:uncharacterized protein (DUF2236 family)